MEEQTDLFKKLMFRLIKKAKAHFEQELKKARVNITPLQYAILVRLGKEGITLNELSQHLANKPPTLIPAITHLESEGFIKKDQDALDRRKVKIVITAAGKGVLKKVPLTNSSDLIKKGLGKLGADKTETLVALLGELVDSIDKK